MTREEAIERFENVKANALVQKASGVSEYWQNEIDGTIEAIDMAIEALQADWISITESEPNTSDHVLVTYKWDEDDYETSELDYWVTKHEAENGNGKSKRLIDHVIAWRRMPEPYKDGE